MKRKLNSKGFTLIELLAVIVILALIMVIAIPNVLEAMNSSRVSSLHSKAKSVASWYTDTVLSESLANKDDSDTSKQILSTDVTKVSGDTWQCIGTDLSTNFAKNAGLSDAEYNLTATTKPGTDGSVSAAATCSAIRTVNGVVEVVLVANPTGKFNVPGKTVTYAYSADPNGTTK